MSVRIRSRFIANVAAAGALIGLLAGAGLQAAPTPAYTPPPITWGACSNPRLQAQGAQCGFLVVPLDYASPNATKINLAVSRVGHHSPDAQFQGPMVVNPGGPGSPGLIFATLGSFVPNHAGDFYDWIGIDLRGIGESQPALSCDPSFNAGPRPPYRPTTLAIEQAWVSRSMAYAAACASAQLTLLKHMRTVDSANDLESLRIALGSPQLNYYGFNYGTYLGQIYATLYPDKVRRLVLDSAVNPLQGGYLASLEQDAIYQRNLDTFFDYLAAHDSILRLGTTRAKVRQLYLSTIAALDANPANGAIGGSEWTDIFKRAASEVFGWADVAFAFSAYVNGGNGFPLVDLYGSPPFDDNSYAVGLATRCTDSPWPTDQRGLDAVSNLLDRGLRYDYFTWANAWQNGPCAYWKVPGQQPIQVNGSKVRDALMIGETFDAVTPFSGSLVVRALFPTASLIEGKNGTTDSGSLSGISCVDDAIVAYLTDGTRPPRKTGIQSDLVCTSVPAPEPFAGTP